MPLLPPVKERQQEDDAEQHRGQSDRGDQRQLAGKVFQELKQRQEIPRRARQEVRRWVSLRPQVRRHPLRKDNQNDEDQQRKKHVLQQLLWVEPLDPVIGSTVKRPGRARSSEEVDVQYRQQSQRQRQQKNVDHKKAGQRQRSQFAAAQHDALLHRADDRHLAGDRRSD